MKGKEDSLVLKDHARHHGVMTEHRNPSHPTRTARARAFLKYVWDDTTAAHRALLRVAPYDDYLINHRHER
jgi:hypothetical protein